MTLVRKIPAPPADFKELFERGGWELVERAFGARSDLIRKWIHLTGAQCRHPRRARRQGVGAIAVNVEGWGGD